MSCLSLLRGSQIRKNLNHIEDTEIKFLTHVKECVKPDGTRNDNIGNGNGHIRFHAHPQGKDVE